MNDRLKIRVWSGNMWLDGNDANIHAIDPDATDIQLEASYPHKKHTIVFCTGLKDKNGKLIFEGDIIEGPVITKESYVARVPSIDNFHWMQELKDALEEGKQIEIIGNIYENPNLLNDEKEKD